MRRSVPILVAVLLMLGVAVSPAGAITGNYVKDTQHPFVGLATFYDANGEFPTDARVPC